MKSAQQKVRQRRTACKQIRDNVSRVLKPLRKSQSLQDIADAIGDDCQRGAVREYILKSRTPSPERLLRIAKLCGMSLTELMDGKKQ